MPYGLNCISSNLYIDVLTSTTPECDFIWICGLYQGNHVKMMSLGWGPYPIRRVCLSKGEIWAQKYA